MGRRARAREGKGEDVEWGDPGSSQIRRAFIGAVEVPGTETRIVPASCSRLDRGSWRARDASTTRGQAQDLAENMGAGDAANNWGIARNFRGQRNAAGMPFCENGGYNGRAVPDTAHKVQVFVEEVRGTSKLVEGQTRWSNPRSSRACCSRSPLSTVATTGQRASDWRMAAMACSIPATKKASAFFFARQAGLLWLV